MKIDGSIDRHVNPAFSVVASSLAFSLIALSVLACSLPFHWGASAGGPGVSAGGSKAALTVSISVPSARTIVASSGDFSTAIATLAIAVVDGSSTTVASDPSVTYSSSATKTFSSLTPGTYTIKVDAFAPGGGASIATGTSVPVNLAADATQTVPVGLSFSQSPTSGAFSLPIQWPFSTGLAYLSASLDGAAMTDPTVNSDTINYSATVAKSGLAGGSHTLNISFKTSSGATTVRGLYVETVNIWDGVTSASWLDSSGTCVAKRIFATTDFFDTNANLGGLLVKDGSTSGVTLATGFSSDTTDYKLYTIPSTQSIVFTPTESVSGQYITYTWNGGAVTDLGSGKASANLAFNTLAYANTLVITVRAPDGVTTKSYTLIWHSSAVTVEVSTATNYQALTFATSAPSVARGGSIDFETNNSVLAAQTTGWTWSFDGAPLSETSQKLTLDSVATSGYSVGGHFISVQVTYNGVTYSANLILMVVE
ncbi:MAG: cadherin-like beta sandwich domain-containing protein [Treponema sp.]|nr:cadherin-like beta sandwich domain-containing protein [Treponema sp.]